GCPPSPEAVLQAVLMIQEIIKKEKMIDADEREELRARMRKEITESAPKPLLIAEQQARASMQIVQIMREPAAPQNPVVAAIEGRFKDQLLDVDDFRGDLSITVKPDRIAEICRALKEDPTTKFDLLSSVTGLDYLGYPDKKRDERFNVVYHLYSIDHGHRLRLKVPLPESAPEADSVTSVWKTANWWGRET